MTSYLGNDATVYDQERGVAIKGVQLYDQIYQNAHNVLKLLP